MKRIFFTLILTIVLLYGCSPRLTNDQKEVKETLVKYTEALRKGDYKIAYGFISEESQKYISQDSTIKIWEISFKEFRIGSFKVLNNIEIYPNNYAVALVEREAVNAFTNKTELGKIDYHLKKQNDTWLILKTDNLNRKIFSLLKLEEFEEAISTAKQSLEIDPFNIRGFDLLVRAFYYIGNNEEAKKYADIGIERARSLLEKGLASKVVLYEEAIGFMYLETTRYNEAIRQFQKCKNYYEEINDNENVKRVSNLIMDFLPEGTPVDSEMNLSFILDSDISLSINEANYDNQKYNLSYSFTNNSKMNFSTIDVKAVWIRSDLNEIVYESIEHLVTTDDNPLEPSCSKSGNLQYLTSTTYPDLTVKIYTSIASSNWLLLEEDLKVASSTLKKTTRLFPVCLNGKYGYIDENGKVAIQPRFEEAQNFSEGLAGIKLGGKFGFINEIGEIVVEPKFYDVEEYSEGLAKVTMGNRWGFIDGNGKHIIEEKYNYGCFSFSEGLAPFNITDLRGYINKKGDVVIKEQFSSAYRFSEGYARVNVGNILSGKWGFIDKSGAYIIEPTFELVWDFSEGLACVKVGNKWGFLNKSGEIEIKPQFDEAGKFSEGLAAVKIDEKWGFIDKNGNVIIHPQFETTSHCKFKEGLVNIKSNGKWGFIDRNGKFAIKPQYDEVFPFDEGIAYVKIGNKGGYIDKMGKYIWTPSK